MNTNICMDSFIHEILAYGEKFSTGELHEALGIRTTEGKRRISRNLSYLISKGTIGRVKRGTFKNLYYGGDTTGKIDYVQIDHGKDKQELAQRFSKFKKNLQGLGHEFNEEALWDYKDRTSIFNRIKKDGVHAGFLLLISEDDPQLQRVIRYVGIKAIGSSLAIFLNGTKDLKVLFPGVTWL